MDGKRKTKTSSEVKRRYNEKTYGTVRAMLPKDLVEAFKKECKNRNVSQAQVIREAIEKFLGQENT